MGLFRKNVYLGNC